jgi:FMN phosphatase YigB (HAD superfamily)
MKIFIDFDDVIFNTKKYKNDFERLFEKHGISRDLLKKYYADPDDQFKAKTFNPWRQIERISKESNFDKGGLLIDIDNFIQDLSAYIFPDVFDFTLQFGAENLLVVSFGDGEFQAKKITGSGIRAQIKNIIVTQDLKSIAIEKIIEKENINPEEKMFFIDDRAGQIENVKKIFPEMNTFLLNRKEGRYGDEKNKYCDWEIHDLLEAQEIIKKLI